MNRAERAELIRAMDTVARCINDEEVFEGWLMCGVADGDITPDTTDEELEWYTDDNDDFQAIMECFLRRMKGAINSGGLYCDGVVGDISR